MMLNTFAMSRRGSTPAEESNAQAARRHRTERIRDCTQPTSGRNATAAPRTLSCVAIPLNLARDLTSGLMVLDDQTAA